MEIGDPTEYTQAMSLLGSYEHWEILTTRGWFKPHIDQWREELKVKLESDRYREMKDMVDNHAGTPQAIQATKWLAERYGEKAPTKRGRPSKAEKEAALKEHIEEETILKEEAERLGLADEN